MIKVQFPEPAFRIKQEAGKEYIFDPLRKKWILLTPEEWVRQNFVQYLTGIKNYPAALIAIEKEIQLGELKKRFDVLVYDNSHQPWMMIECKEMNVVLDETVLQQVLRYNISVPVRYLIVTNGSYTFGWEKAEGRLIEMAELPQRQPPLKANDC